MALLEPRQGLAGQYGYANGAPILNADVAKGLLGDEIYKPLDIEKNELGWGTNSRYQGSISTGAAIYGIRGKKSEIQQLLDIGQKAREDFQRGNIIAEPDGEGGTYFRQVVQTPEGPSTTNAVMRFNTAGEDGNNATENFAKWQDTVNKLQGAARNLGIDTTGMTDRQVFDAVNAKENRVAVTGRTQFWDRGQTGIGGVEQSPEHATVLFNQQDGQLVAAAAPRTFNFQDPKTGGNVFTQLVREGLMIPPIMAAIGAYAFGPGGLLGGEQAAAPIFEAIPVPAADVLAGAATPSAIPASSLLPSLAEIGQAVPTPPPAPPAPLPTAPTPIVPSAFETAVNTTLGNAPQVGTFGPAGTAGFGTALPSAAEVAIGLQAAGFAPGTAANLAGTTAAGVGATNLLGGATAAAPVAGTPGITPADALRAANAARQLLGGQQLQGGDMGPQQIAGGGPTGVDYSGIMNLLASQARTSGLLGTQFQPQPINLASLLG